MSTTPSDNQTPAPSDIQTLTPSDDLTPAPSISHDSSSEAASIPTRATPPRGVGVGGGGALGDELSSLSLSELAERGTFLLLLSSPGIANKQFVASEKAALRIQLQARLLALRSQKPLSTANAAPSSQLSPPPSPSSSQASTIPDTAPEIPELDSRILSFALSRSKALTTHTLSNLYRLCGVTTFQARELSGETLLGLRFDVFSPGGKRFVTPVYVLLELRQVEKGAEKFFVVARHSAPAFLGLAELAGRYLPAKGNQDLVRFVKEFRRRVLRWRRRADEAEAAKEAANAASGEGWKKKVEKVEYDAEVALITVKWDSGTEARCRVDEKGDIFKAVATDRKGVRLVEVEQEMKGALKALPQRMGWTQQDL
jgi:hypothetical protein